MGFGCARRGGGVGGGGRLVWEGLGELRGVGVVVGVVGRVGGWVVRSVGGSVGGWFGGWGGCEFVFDIILLLIPKRIFFFCVAHSTCTSRVTHLLSLNPFLHEVDSFSHATSQVEAFPPWRLLLRWRSGRTSRGCCGGAFPEFPAPARGLRVDLLRRARGGRRFARYRVPHGTCKSLLWCSFFCYPTMCNDQAYAVGASPFFRT